MSKTLIRDIVTLTREGWRPYGAEPQGEVYTRLGCTKHKQSKPYWFVRGDIYLCVGCAQRCSLSRPDGFPLPLPIKYPQPETPYALTPIEMVRRRHLLTVKEAGYCLNVSDRTVYAWIENGILTAVKLTPKRVLASDVDRLMNSLDV